MSQRRSIVNSSLLLWIVGVMAASVLGAADRKTDQANWDNLKPLSQGQEIKVVLNDVKAYKGLFQSVSDDGIAVALRTGNATFARQDILRVSYKTGSHRLRNAGIGAAIGGGALAAAFGAKPPFCEQENGCPGDRGVAAVAGVGIGAAIGAGVGAVFPASDAFRDVYRAR